MRPRILAAPMLAASLFAAAIAGAGLGPLYNAFPEGQVAVTGSMRTENPGATFAFPPAVTSSDLRTSLRAELERLGYTFVEDAASADFWADVSVGRTEVRRGPRVFANPRYVSPAPSGGGRVVVHIPGTSSGVVERDVRR